MKRLELRERINLLKVTQQASSGIVWSKYPWTQFPLNSVRGIGAISSSTLCFTLFYTSFRMSHSNTKRKGIFASISTIIIIIELGHNEIAILWLGWEALRSTQTNALWIIQIAVKWWKVEQGAGLWHMLKRSVWECS